ncbi:MAG: hypothetical protein JWN94_3179 [Betaproteobacteria bacterium]|nr:hypothetical protein [Betaproteobacteria bacterium]
MKRARLIDIGLAILIGGFAAATLIYVFADDAASEVEFANPRAYENQIERIGGKATLYAVRFNEWLASLWHGKSLAYTVAVISLAISVGFFWSAARARSGEDRPQDSNE